MAPKFDTKLNAAISEELDKRLNKAAEMLDRSKSYLTRQALEAYLTRIEETGREQSEDARPTEKGA